MNDNNPKTMYETVPMAAELNKVPGFDPLKFLRRTKDALKLDLSYQKLWFRMAHPNGRMRLTALRITEQMAIFEAKVFLDRSDAEPFSMSTAQQTTQDSRDFVKAAQNAALSQALTDAGFGIQLISAAPPAAGQEEPAAPASRVQQPATAAVRPKPPQEPVRASQKPASAGQGNETAKQIEGQDEASGGPERPAAEKPLDNGEQADTLPVVLPLSAEKPKPETLAAESGQTPAYTQDTPVEEILKAMTLEQAQQVVVDDGICQGMTIAQVAEKRPVSLRFYLIPGKSKNNMVRAAAQLVLDSLQKAG